jgi:hypothetical protein
LPALTVIGPAPHWTLVHVPGDAAVIAATVS